ncbi:hypothetical protein AT5A_14742 [Agrobacterium tumefaciens 5A]|nr:hypothetical protein AT5A_14742 [Agrobacterium tumefaciens 5A]
MVDERSHPQPLKPISIMLTGYADNLAAVHKVFAA